MPAKKRKTQKEQLKEDLREEFKKEIEELNNNLRELIKDKGVFYNQKINQKIDPIVSDEFIKKLRGNGFPGVFELIRDNDEEIKKIEEFKKSISGNGTPGALEQIRSLKKQIKVMWVVIFTVAVLMVGGEKFGCSLEKIRTFFGIKTSQQTEKAPCDIVIEKDNNLKFEEQ